MHRRLAFIAVTMALAFAAFIAAIKYAEQHPITEAEISAQHAR